MDVETQANTSDRRADFRAADEASLPLGYGSDRLELMWRDPGSAQAFWDLSIDRIKVAAGPHDRVRLRLIGIPSGYVLAEHAVPAQRGSRTLALPEADSSYLVELAVMRNYEWVVLARSNVVHAPPTTPRVTGTPVFVSRGQRLRLLADRSARPPTGSTGPAVTVAVEVGPAVTERPHEPADTAAPARMGSEARLLPFAQERPLVARPSFPGPGSQARPAQPESAHTPFLMAGTPGMPEPVTLALGALAAAVWLGRDPVDVLRAGTSLIAALSDAGLRAGPTVAILDPPGPDVGSPEPATPRTALPGGEAYTVTEHPDRSITVADRSGHSITYSPVQPAGINGTRRSAAALVEVRHAS